MNQQSGGADDSADAVQIYAIGLVIELRFDPHMAVDTRRRVIRAWSGSLVYSAGSDIVLDVCADGRSTEQFLEQLSVRVTLAALEARKGEVLAFHACAVAMQDGRAVAFVGPSGSGKTTLAHTLGSLHGYISDETVAVDANMHISPYRKPLSLVDGLGPKKQMSPVDAGLRDLPPAPPRLAALVLLHRDPEATETLVRGVPLLTALAQLIPESSYTASMKEPLQRLASLCGAVGGVQRLTYRDTSEVPEVLERLLAERTSAEGWIPADEVLSSGGDWQLGDIDDAIECAGEVAVFSDQRFRILSGIAPAIWHAVRNGKQFDEIVQAVVDQHGQPGESDADTLVGSAIEELAAEGLLCRSR